MDMELAQRTLRDRLDEVDSFPRLELHRHLEGAVRLQTIADVVRRYDIDLPSEPEQLRPLVQIVPGDPRTMAAFLGKFRVLRQVFRDMEVVARIAREAIEDAVADRITYMELRFTPIALTRISGASVQEAIAVVCKAVNEAAQRNGVQAGLIVSLNRHEVTPTNEAVVQGAIDHRQQGVVAIDLAGDETSSSEPFVALFREARADGLPLTVHAGEWQGAASLRAAMDGLHPMRIGHGVRALEDASVLRDLAQRGIVLEVCPSSNVDSGVVPDLDHHPLPRLLDAGLLVTVNTDDPSLSAITLGEEYRRCVRDIGLMPSDLRAMIGVAARAAFLPEPRKAQLIDETSRAFQEA
jgi:adenosine deaminase